MDVSIVQNLLQRLPLSPFAPYIEELSSMPYLPYINWFIPVGAFVKIGMSWLVAVSAFYIVSVALRWAKVIE